MDLKTYLASTDTLSRDFAVQLGVHASMVSQWLTGRRKVSANYCLAIEHATAGAVTCEELRPDLARHWAYMRQKVAA